MKALLDAHDLFADLMMTRQVDARLALVVEGPEDVGVLGPHVNDAVCRIEVGHGKPNATALARLLADSSVTHVAVLIDRDFDSDSSHAEDLRDTLFLTDGYDLLMDVLRSCPAILDRLLHNYGDVALVQTYCGTVGREPFAVISEQAVVIGALRFVSEREGLALKMRGFPATEVVAAYATGTLIPKVVAIAIARTGATESVDPASLSALVSTTVEAGDFALINSHDLISILAAQMRAHWGGVVALNGAEMLSRTVRTAIGCDCLLRLTIAATLSEWASHRTAHPIWTCAA